MFQKRVTVRAISKGKIENLGIFKRLLHTSANTVIIVFRFDDGDRNPRLVIKKIVGFFGFTAPYGLTANDYAPFREVDLLSKLGHDVPLAAV